MIEIRTDEFMPVIDIKKIKKRLPELFKFIKKADNIEFDINLGTAEAPDINSHWLKSEYDGESKITFRLYHKSRDNRKKLYKQ